MSNVKSSLLVSLKSVGLFGGFFDSEAMVSQAENAKMVVLSTEMTYFGCEMTRHGYMICLYNGG
jgi:hypothetical protein